MALINIGAVRKKALAALSGIDPPGGVELLSYKRNRFISIVRVDDESYLVRERGYRDQEIRVIGEELPRLLRGLIKREFPRSRKVRLVKFTDPGELDRLRQKI